MEKRILITLVSLLLLNSCIVKSLHPFYTTKTISYQEKFIGEWKTSRKNEHWKVISFKESFLEKKEFSKLSKEELKEYNQIKDSYLITFIDQDSTTAKFIATPFKINNELFLDFALYGLNNCDPNLLGLHHMMTIHSLVKFDILTDDSISLSWLDEDKIKELFKSKKIKIKHEKIMDKNEYLLTSSPEELQKFIKKYINSKDPKKWETDIKFKLKRIK